MLTDLDAYLAKIEPSLPALSHDLEVAPQVLRAYGDAASDFVAVADNAARSATRSSTRSRISTLHWSA